MNIIKNQEKLHFLITFNVLITSLKYKIFIYSTNFLLLHKIKLYLNIKILIFSLYFISFLIFNKTSLEYC